MAEADVKWIDELTLGQYLAVTVALAWCVFVVVFVVLSIGLLIRLLT